MVNDERLIAFGPVPSRRLGHSLGINNIPPKICTYSCIYCQLGRTNNLQVERKEFYKPIDIKNAVNNKVQEVRGRKETIDYLTFVTDGEPTLDTNLGKEIRLLKPLEIKIAVITNASLLWMKDVRDELSKADWVSVKIDAISQDIWRKINRAHGTLKLDTILQGILNFSREFKGELATESMLIQNVNDSYDEVEKIADFIGKLNPKKSYISIPTRPPAEKWTISADEFDINVGYQIFKERGIDVELKTGYEGNAFAFSGNVEKDLLSITSVHPMRQDSVRKLLSKARADWDIINKLIKDDKLSEVKYKDKKFYIRKHSIKNS